MFACVRVCERVIECVRVCVCVIAALPSALSSFVQFLSDDWHWREGFQRQPHHDCGGPGPAGAASIVLCIKCPGLLFHRIFSCLCARACVCVCHCVARSWRAAACPSWSPASPCPPSPPSTPPPAPAATSRIASSPACVPRTTTSTACQAARALWTLPSRRQGQATCSAVW